MKLQIRWIAAIILSLSFTLPAFAGAPEAKAIKEKPKVELVFVLDTTGSMSSLIKGAKEKIWSITNTIADAKEPPEISIGIIGYRDRGDAYVTRFTEMTDNLDHIYKQLMEFQAEGGGDTPESVNQALYEAVTNNNWKKDESVYKVIFLVGDAPPKMNYKDDVKYRKTCRLAKERGIVINAIQCGDISGTEPVWREIAELAGGEYFHVSQSGNYNVYTTPFDKEIAEKSKALDKTRLYYGDAEFMKEKKIKMETEDEIYSRSGTSSIAQRTLFNAKGAGKKNFLGEQELVDGVENGSIRIEEIRVNELPEEMQKMDMTKRKAYIEEKKAERKRLTKEIRELSDKRQKNILEQVKKEEDGGKNSLDMKIYDCIKKQARDKGIEYTEGVKY